MAEINTKNKVDHPDYYNSGKIEVIDFIEDWGLGFHLGNAVKYIARYQYKYTDPRKKKEDLEKALWYLNRYVAHYESRELPPPCIGSIKVSEFCGEHQVRGGAIDVIMLICFANRTSPSNVVDNIVKAISRLQNVIDSL